MGLASDLFRLALGVERLVAEVRGWSRPVATPGPVAAAHAIVVRDAPIRTLCVELGDSGIHALIGDHAGNVVSPREHIDTPRPATPEAVLAAVDALALRFGGRAAFERVSVGFPGVVVGGVTRGAAHLDARWADFALATRLGERLERPTRAANDAGMRGLSLIEGQGVELVLLLGVGLGSGLYVDGRPVPNFALAHHPFKKGQTYEERIGDAARQDIGNRRWRKRVLEVVLGVEPVFNCRALYLAGANARRLDASELPESARIVEDGDGLLGGVRLWEAERG